MESISYVTVLVVMVSSALGDFNSLEENLVFKINWPGAEVNLAETVDSSSENAVIMTTVENERYKCVLPLQILQHEGEEELYTGSSALELLMPLFSSNLCIFKLEQYWGYELCHGKHLRQFHEEKETGKEVAVQEYFLGRYNNLLWKKDVEAFVKEWEANKIPTMKVEGQKLPYVEVTMPDGTLCDLNGSPRQAKIKYGCSPDTKHQIYSIEESSICEYEVLVLTRFLCSHPNYSLKTPKTNEIHCQAIDDASKRPAVLENLESESHQLNPYSKLTEAILKQFGNLDELTSTEASLQADQFTEQLIEEKTPPYDSKLVNDILNGDHCLNGGAGWWKYEFCYGKKVEQYHVESGGSRIVNTLGTWNKEKHMKWLDKHPHKKSNLKKSKQVSLLYSDGDLCTETLKPRQVEVQLRCKESPDHPNAVSMSLLEPSICEYILIVESQIFCSLISKLDEYGIAAERLEL